MKKAVLPILIVIIMLVSACSVFNAYDENTGTIDLSQMKVTGDGISVVKSVEQVVDDEKITISGNIIKITEGGEFVVVGENDNAMIYVNTEDKVKLRLSGMSLKCDFGPAILFDAADKAFITITENTENYIEDAASYGQIDAKAALFSNDDLEIKGKGTLTIVGNYKHAIAGDDDVDIENGIINITANVKDGIHTNNTFKMTGGTLNISAGSDGIQAEEDVIIEDGTINIIKSKEGIESGTSLTINDGDISIVASDDGLNSGGGNGGGDNFFQGGRMGGNRPEMSDMTGDFDPNAMQGGFRQDGNNQRQPMDGNMQQMPQGERGMNRPEMPNLGEPNLGEPNMGQSNLGKPNLGEPNMGDPNMGDPNMGGQNPSEQNLRDSNKGNNTEMPAREMPAMNNNTSDNSGNASAQNTDRNIYINGGNIYINAQGDGIDSNAEIYVSGGNVVVDGPESNADAAIDGNRFVVTGGTVLAVGSSGMAVGASTDSTQCAFLVNMSETVNAGSVITVKDSEGNTIVEHTAKKRFNSIEYTDKKLTLGETYTVYVDGVEKTKVEMTSAQMNSGGMGGMRGGMMNGGMMNGGMNRSNRQMNVTQQSTNSDRIRVIMQGKEIMFDTNPVIENGTTLVPLRAIFDALNMSVEWDGETKTVTAAKDGLNILLQIGNTVAKKNGEDISLLTAPKIDSNNRTLVPVRFIAESCNLNVEWDAATKTVSIS